MKETKPVIGVTGPTEGGIAAWLFIKLGIWLQGGKAVHITTKKKYPAEELDGLVLGGGADLNPQRYGQQRNESIHTGNSKERGIWQYVIQGFSLVLYPIIFLVRKLFSVNSRTPDKERDELELHYLNKALERELPILGLCRGAQLINVKMGGTLYQDITGFYGEVPRVYSIFPKKSVEVDLDSRLGAILNSSEIKVNAMHNQAIDELAPSLTAVAREQTGIIQAIEHAGHRFLVGVQWHPEYMPHIEKQRNIFRTLVQTAAEVNKN